jgi:hypothetical protein
MFDNGYAVIVGVGADLPVTIADATAVADLLRDPSRCAYPVNQVKLLTGKNAHRESILSSLDWLADTTNPEATVIFYFSGHGIENPDYYLMPFGYSFSNLANTAISEIELTQRLQAIKAKKLVILLDCCHAGGQVHVKGATNAPLPSTVINELAECRGKVILASSRKDEVSFTGDPYSAFTVALLEGFAGYGSFEQDGYARILDLAMWVGRKVPERTEDRQHPIIKVNHLEENFALAWYAAGQKTPQALEWTPTIHSSSQTIDNNQRQSLHLRLKNYQDNLLLIEERMSEYMEYTAIPLQLLKEKQRTETNIKELEKKLE